MGSGVSESEGTASSNIPGAWRGRDGDLGGFVQPGLGWGPPSWSPGWLCWTGALVWQQCWLQPRHGQAVHCSPPQIHTFWVDAKNYVEHTRKWYAETIPFPLNFFLPNAMHKRHLERLQLMWGNDYMEDEEKLEKEVRDGVWAWWVLGVPLRPKSKLASPLPLP